MDEQNNASQPEEGASAAEAAAQDSTQAVAGAATDVPTQPMAQPGTRAAATQPAAQPSGEATVTQPAVAPTQAMPVATQPAAPQVGAQPGAPVNPGMPPQGVAATAPMGAYPPPKPTGALVCGILSIVFASIVGLILGIIAIVQSNKYIKAGGTEGTGKAAKICGIIGVVLSAISTIAVCCAIAFGLVALNDYNNANGLYAGTPSSTTNTFQSSSAASGSLSEASPEDEAAVYAVVDAELDKVKNLDPAMVASISKVIADSLNDALATQGITLADLQVDPTALTTAMLQGFDYEQYYVDVSGDEAEANYRITCKNMYSVMSEFYDQLMEMMETEASQYSNTEAAYVAIGEALMASVEATPVGEPELFDVDLNKIGGNWVIDQDSWDDEIDYFFGA